MYITFGRGGVGLTSCRLGFGGIGDVSCLTGGRAETEMWFNVKVWTKGKAITGIIGFCDYLIL